MAKSKKPKRKTPKREKAKKRKLKKTKTQKRVSRFAKSHKASGVPRGFVDVVQKTTAEEAYAEIKARLESARLILQTASGIDSRVRVHSYADGSIDGELLVKIPHGVSTNDVVLEMETAVGRMSMPGFWLNMGTRFTIKEDEEVYRRFRGFNDVNTHYQSARPANWSEIPLILRKVIVAGMEHKYGRKAESVYTRLHWSPDGSKPRTRG